ncbi:MAG: CHAT domain-containing protein [Actinomycetota bacterium]
MQRTRVLAFSANKTSNSLDVDSELRAIRQALDGVATVDHLPAARAEELVSDLSADPPVIMHFMGHGSPMGLELAYGRDDFRPADGQALREVLAGRGVQLVVLSSCYSAAQAHQIAQSVDAVVGTSEALEDESTAMFSNAFYKALRRGATVAEALRDGQDAVRLQHASDQFEIVGNKQWRLQPGASGKRPASRGSGRSGSRPPASMIAAGLAALAVAALLILGVRSIARDDSVEATGAGLGSESSDEAAAPGVEQSATDGATAVETTDTTAAQTDLAATVGKVGVGCDGRHA